MKNSKSQIITKGKITMNGKVAGFEGENTYHWSVLQCKNASGNGRVYPIRLRFNTPVSSIQVAWHCLMKRKGFKHFFVSPVAPFKTADSR